MDAKFPVIVLLSGWGMPDSIWDDFCACLPGDLQVKKLRLPVELALDDALSELAEQLPKHCILVGWSLGGVVASLLAADNSNHVAGLVTIATNRCFVAHKKWPTAMDGSVFLAFFNKVENSPEDAWQKFNLLCSEGSLDRRKMLRRARKIALYQSGYHYVNGLKWLQQADLLSAWWRYQGKSMHIFAESDGLIPEVVVDLLKKELSEQKHEIVKLSGSHLLPLEHPQKIASQVNRLCREVG